MKRFWLLVLMLMLVLSVAPVAAQAGSGDSPLPTEVPPTWEATPSPTPMFPPATGGGDVPALELSGPGLAAITAVLLSVGMAYIPGFQVFWDAHDGAQKRMLMGAAGLVVALALVGLHFAGAVDLGFSGFGWPVVGAVASAWLTFAGAGQLAYTFQQALPK